ncbi:MAG TPA: zf-HC2 domain-containing protein [Pyrinomonadaceae bacterium]
MNCKNAQELLPLYVGGDLEEKVAKIVSAHLQSCRVCGYSADEYRETLQLVQRFEPPAFSNATYSTVRRSVLREIERESNKSGLFDFITGAFQPRVLWAVTTVVLLAFCLSVYYFVANRTNGNTPQIVANPGGKQNPGDQQISVKPQSDQFATNMRPDRVGTVGGPVIAPRNSPNSGSNPPTRRVRHFTRPSRAPAASSRPVEQKVAPLNTAVTSDKTLRLEIQTSDPDIRILWFSHSSTDEGSAKETSKGR